jgi:queuine tRNA-ribosyltransferase
MKRLDCEVVATRGGALAVRDKQTGEVMHPMGPLQEAQDVYVGPSRIEARLREGGPPLVLLDVGLGAGTNALAALQIAESLADAARRLEIVSFEHDLGALELALDPAHGSAFGLGDPLSVAHRAARELLAQGRASTPRVSWRLCFGDVLHALANEPLGSADLVFWDMFSSKVHPEVWSARAFAALRRVCRSGATVHTYSAATPTRAASGLPSQSPCPMTRGCTP